MSLAWLAVLAVLTGDEDRFQSLLAKTEQLAGTHALGVFDAQVRDALHWARGLRELTAGQPESAVTWFSAMTHPAVAGMAAALDRIEAAIHSGRRDEALEWVDRLERAWLWHIDPDIVLVTRESSRRCCACCHAPIFGQVHGSTEAGSSPANAEQRPANASADLTCQAVRLTAYVAATTTTRALTLAQVELTTAQT